MINVRALLFLLVATFSSAVFADALAPSLLELKEHSEDHTTMKWKVSLKNAPTRNITPVLSSDCQQVLEDEQELDGIRLTSWELRCNANTLVGKIISMHGLESSGASVLLKVHLHDGQFYQRVLSAENSTYRIPEAQGRLEIFSNYIVLGIKHLLVGVDHVLFVTCLVLLVSARRKLILVVSLFTVGHSITLSLSTLGLVTISTALAEVFIAFSVVYAASELLDNNDSSWLKKYPAVMAAFFGLLHGLGFASVLSDAGIPQLHIPLSLFSFNVGIEIGQVIVISILLGLWRLLRDFIGQVKIKFPVYVVGCLSSLWFWERTLG